MQMIKYRADIDGLRAVAVLSVIVYHLNPSWLPGGFLGVDIFFVISGYLITKIIYLEIANGNFSFIEFYKRRAKRILPVFSFVIFCSFILATLLFTNDDYYNYLRSAKSAFLFYANIYFGKNFDYFDISSLEKPLLHIWYLSVEEQFYFIFPIVLISLVRNISKDKIHFFILFLIGASIVFKYYPVSKYDAYYLPHLRFYELLIGSLIVFLKPRRLNNVFHIFLFGIVVSAFFLPKGMLIGDGYIERIVVCSSIATLILTPSNQSIVTKLLSIKFLVFIGLLSYSLYLWHWTLLSFIRYVYIDPVDVLLYFIVLLFLLSYFSYVFIETPVRKKNISHKVFLYGMLCYFLLPISIELIRKVEKNTPKDELQEPYYTWDTSNTCYFHEMQINQSIEKECTKGDTSSSIKILALGDSHMTQYAELIDIVGRKEGWSADVISSPSCPFNVNFRVSEKDHRFPACNLFIEHAKRVLDNYDVIILAARWGAYIGNDEYKKDKLLENLKETLDFLQDKQKIVYLLEDNRDVGISPIRFSKLKTLGIYSELNDVSAITYDELGNKKVKELSASYANVYWIDSIVKHIPQSLIIDNKYIYWDSNHLSPYGSRKIAERFIEADTLLLKQ
ncbi:TPA: acyltransferase, partial [Pasteurella multocida]|nr:acyltransferase [Pasteurella multocida]